MSLEPLVGVPELSLGQKVGQTLQGLWQDTEVTLVLGPKHSVFRVVTAFVLKNFRIGCWKH